MSSLALYFHTVRHLRPVQIGARVWFRLHRPSPDLRAPPATRSITGQYRSPIAPAPSLLGPDTFRFHLVARRCTLAADWSPPDAAKLWIYHLHYFDDLNARDADERRAWHEHLLTRWVSENPPGQGEGWEPYPVSRRIVNWVKWAARGNVVPHSVNASLAVQARWLARRLEYHILGNHLLANAKALLHAGLYFEGAEADLWRARATAVLARELGEQVLPDGGHFELSTMYQCFVLEDLLDMVNLLQCYGRSVPQGWLDVIARMRQWLRVMTHPDGNIAFFNDAAFDMAPTLGELEAYASRLGLSATADLPGAVVALQPSGYVRVRVGLAYLICDCAAVGADHLPGHAHADSLSFELSVAGRRVFVNSGTSLYGNDIERQRQRGTQAHNTVVVDGHDSSEMWAGFRVARRARITRCVVSSTALATTVDASHDGYRRLRGRNEHRRRWTVDDHSLHIEDTISGGHESAVAYFYLHPDIDARIAGDAEVILKGREGVPIRMVFAGAAAIELRPSTWHPRFGLAVANCCVVARFSAGTLQTRVSWAAA